MNHRQKLGYTVLGAAIMLVGLGLGTIFSPPLIAQRDGADDEIVCRKIAIVDENGTPGIILAANKEANGVLLANKSGKDAILLYSGEDGTSAISIFNEKEENVIGLMSFPKSITVLSVNNESGKNAISLSSSPIGNRVVVSDKAGENAIELQASILLGNLAKISDEEGNVSWEAP